MATAAPSPDAKRNSGQRRNCRGAPV